MDDKIIDEEIMKELEKKLSNANAYEERLALMKEYADKIYIND
tara:strand:- start:580 stop:708 length:129 start_codon:yes stop_codon:yes gene_type:complete